jgi:hypothetical protein
MQTKLTSFIESSNMEYQECLLDWMVSSYQPFSAIQNDSFHKMVHSLNKKAPVIGEDKIRSLMSMKYFETMQSITKIVKGKDVTLTTDAWTSIAKEGYVTCHYGAFTPFFLAVTVSFQGMPEYDFLFFS